MGGVHTRSLYTCKPICMHVLQNIVTFSKQTGRIIFNSMYIHVGIEYITVLRYHCKGCPGSVCEKQSEYVNIENAILCKREQRSVKPLVCVVEGKVGLY